jgi:hypothetical protein
MDNVQHNGEILDCMGVSVYFTLGHQETNPSNSPAVCKPDLILSRNGGAWALRLLFLEGPGISQADEDPMTEV